MCYFSLVNIAKKVVHKGTMADVAKIFFLKGIEEGTGIWAWENHSRYDEDEKHQQRHEHFI